MAKASLTGLIVNTVIGALGSGFANMLKQSQMSESAKAQAKILLKSVGKLEQQMKNGQITFDNLLKELDTMKAGLEPKLKQIMENSLKIAENQLQDYYKKTVSEMNKINIRNREKLRTGLAQRRLAASGVGAEAFRKLNEEQQQNLAKLNEDVASREERMRQKALNDISKQVVGAEQNYFNQKSNLTQGRQNYTDKYLNDILQLKQRSDTLNTVKHGGAEDFFIGALGDPNISQGIGSILKKILEG